MLRRLAPALIAIAAAACATPRPSDLPSGEPWIVAVKSCRLPDAMQWYTHFAHHTWIDVKRGGERKWERVEVLSETSGAKTGPIPARVAASDWRWDRPVRLLAQFEGPAAERIAARLEACAKEHDPLYLEHYDAWPGPNSNTFMAELAREIPELAFVFDHNAVGKDYGGWFSAGATASKTGFHVDTVPLGFTFGLREGIELHFLELNFGVQLWPPRIELPFLPELPPPSSPPPELSDLALLLPEPVDEFCGGEFSGLNLLSVPLRVFKTSGSIGFVDAGTGDWVRIEYTRIEPCDEHRSGAVRCDARIHGELESTRTDVIDLDDGGQARFGNYPFGPVHASIRFERDPAARWSARLDVSKNSD
jgi:hypothetical protein